MSSSYRPNSSFVCVSKALSTLATVAKNGDCRRKVTEFGDCHRKLRLSPNSATN